MVVHSRGALFATGLALALVCVVGCSEAPGALDTLDRKHVPVVLYLVDTLRADHLGCYGYARGTSPRVDALAAEGVRFDSCQAQSTWTKPATASVLTGLLPSRHGAIHAVSTLLPGHELVSTLFAEGGYATGAFGTNGYVFSEGQGFERDFDRFLTADDLVRDPGRRVARSAEVVDAALEWVREVAGHPFFLYVHVVDPHDPYDPPEAYRNRFTSPLADPRWMDEELERPPAREEPLPPEALERMVGLYDAEIAYADAEFGRLLDGLAELGLYDQALVVFVADHGEEFFDHGSWRHNPNMFQEVVRVPLVVKFPRALGSEFEHRVHSDLVRQVDILPTLLDVTGLEARKQDPSPSAGRSLLWTLQAPASVPPVAVTETSSDGAYRKALLTEGLMYVRTWEPTVGEALYDLKNDPLEREDLAARRPADIERLRAVLLQNLGDIERGWTLGFHNQTERPITFSGWMRLEGAEWSGLDPIGLELEGSPPEGLDGPLRYGRVRVATDPAGGTRVVFGAGTDTERVLSLAGPCEDFEGPAAWFIVRTAPGDRDAIGLLPSAPASSATLALWADGQPLPPAHVRLGSKATPAPSMPVLLDRALPFLECSAALLEESQPALPPGAPAAWVRLWKNLDPRSTPAALSAAARANLAELGYGGEDEGQ